jgi:molybdopterin molybdotransferase
MPALRDDCFTADAPLLNLAEALQRLEDMPAVPPAIETVRLAEAVGRILAEPIAAPRSVPPHDNAAVDGYACRFADLAGEGETRLAVAGRAAAGHEWGRTVQPGEAVRILTGAVMPAGADTVIMQEDCREADGFVDVPAGIKQGANRRFAGEDVAAGPTILADGRRLRPQDVGLAASVGLTRLPVFAGLRVALFSTGDEVCEPGSELPPGAIYDSNRYALLALLQGLGCRVSDLGIRADRFEAIRDTLAEASRDHDLLVTSGGMSTGEEDHMKAAVEALGRLDFWRLAIKPGRPVALGRIDRGIAGGTGAVPFIGLPGNPVAVMVTFLLIARPLILKLSGAAASPPQIYPVRAGFACRKKPGRREYLRARLELDAEGRLLARRFPRDGAGILSSMVGSDGLVVLGEAVTAVAEGDRLDFLPFSEVMG